MTDVWSHYRVTMRTNSVNKFDYMVLALPTVHHEWGKTRAEEMVQRRRLVNEWDEGRVRSWEDAPNTPQTFPPRHCDTLQSDIVQILQRWAMKCSAIGPEQLRKKRTITGPEARHQYISAINKIRDSFCHVDRTLICSNTRPRSVHAPLPVFTGFMTENASIAKLRTFWHTLTN